MNIVKSGIMVTTLVILAACEQQGTVTPKETSKQDAQTTPIPEYAFAEWEGKWVGVEGMFVEISLLETGKYNLIMQSDLDTYGTYSGTDSEQGIQFTRKNQVFTLRKASGDETGLRYLAGKKDCLMVVSGEGYCRD